MSASGETTSTPRFWGRNGGAHREQGYSNNWSKNGMLRWQLVEQRIEFHSATPSTIELPWEDHLGWRQTLREETTTLCLRVQSPSLHGAVFILCRQLRWADKRRRGQDPVGQDSRGGGWGMGFARLNE